MQKYRRLVVSGLLLGILASIAVTLLSDVSHLPDQAVSFPWILLIVALVLRVANWGLRFLKWQYYLRLVGVRNLSVRDSAAVYVTGFPLSASPGKLAELLKSFILKNLTGTPVAVTLPVIAAERFSDGIAVLILLAWAILNLDAGQYWPVVGVSLALFAIGITILQIRPLCLALLDRLSRAPLIGRWAHTFEHFYESSYKIAQLRSVIIAAGIGVVANSLDGLGVFCILIGLGLPATTHTFFQGLLVISLSVVAGSVSGSPGGIGASDLTIAGSLVLIVHLNRTEAGFATLLARFVQLWWGVIVGGSVAILARKRLFPPSLERIIEEESTQADQPMPDDQIGVTVGS